MVMVTLKMTDDRQSTLHGCILMSQMNGTTKQRKGGMLDIYFT